MLTQICGAGCVLVGTVAFALLLDQMDGAYLAILLSWVGAGMMALVSGGLAGRPSPPALVLAAALNASFCGVLFAVASRLSTWLRILTAEDAASASAAVVAIGVASGVGMLACLIAMPVALRYWRVSETIVPELGPAGRLAAGSGHMNAMEQATAVAGARGHGPVGGQVISPETTAPGFPPPVTGAFRLDPADSGEIVVPAGGAALRPRSGSQPQPPAQQPRQPPARVERTALPQQPSPPLQQLRFGGPHTGQHAFAAAGAPSPYPPPAGTPSPFSAPAGTPSPSFAPAAQQSAAALPMHPESAPPTPFTAAPRPESVQVAPRIEPQPPLRHGSRPAGPSLPAGVDPDFEDRTPPPYFGGYQGQRPPTAQPAVFGHEYMPATPPSPYPPPAFAQGPGFGQPGPPPAFAPPPVFRHDPTPPRSRSDVDPMEHTPSRRGLWIALVGLLAGGLIALVVLVIDTSTSSTTTSASGPSNGGVPPDPKTIVAPVTPQPAQPGAAVSPDGDEPIKTAAPTPRSPTELLDAVHEAARHGDAAMLEALVIPNAFGFGVKATSISRTGKEVAAAFAADLGAPPGDGFVITPSGTEIGEEGNHAWIAEELEVGAGPEVRRFAITLLATRPREVWRVVAWHWAVRLPDETIDALVEAGDLPIPEGFDDRLEAPPDAVEVFRAAFYSTESYALAVSPRITSFNFGSAPGERLKGGDTIRRVFRKLRADIRLSEGVMVSAAGSWDPAAAAAPTVAWAAANVEFSTRKSRRILRVLAVMVKESDEWRIVQTQWSDGG